GDDALVLDQGPGQVAHQGHPVGGVAAQLPAGFAVSHGSSPSPRAAPRGSSCGHLTHGAQPVGLADLLNHLRNEGSFMPRCRPRSASLFFTSFSVVSPKLRTSSNSSSVRITRSRTVVMPSDSRQFVARTDNSSSARLMFSLRSSS